MTSPKRQPLNRHKKGWATRRRKRKAELKRIEAEAAKLKPELDKLFEGTPAVSTDTANDNKLTAQAAATNSIPRSEAVDAVGRTLEMHRDEQIACFLADMVAMRQMGGMKGHFPIMVSRSQIEAIEEFLTDHGYSGFGKGSGSLMSVSTKPQAA